MSETRSTNADSPDVLIVEDDEALRELLEVQMRAQRWPVRTAANGLLALEQCAQRVPDVLVLDVMLPECDGIEVCRRVRQLYFPSPGVLMLTARDSEVEVVLGLEVGADDYVIKPCRPKILIARIQALARRIARPGSGSVPPPNFPIASEETLERGSMRIELGPRRVTVDGRMVKLTPTEFSMLVLLARNPDHVFPRMELLEKIWDTTHEGYVRNVDCHVTRVRRKLEAAGLNPAPIQTSHGTGYYFVSS